MLKRLLKKQINKEIESSFQRKYLILGQLRRSKLFRKVKDVISFQPASSSNRSVGGHGQERSFEEDLSIPNISSFIASRANIKGISQTADNKNTLGK